MRRFQELVSREPQVAFGPVGPSGIVAEAIEMSAPRWRDEVQRRGIAIAVTAETEGVPPVEGNGFELRAALVQLIQSVSPATRVVVPTGWGDRAAGGEGGRFVDQVIAKPISRDALLGELASMRPTRAGRR